MNERIGAKAAEELSDSADAHMTQAVDVYKEYAVYLVQRRWRGHLADKKYYSA